MIDDGSKDDTLTVARSFAEKDSRVRVYHQENAGVSVARNHGIREAKGEYLVFLDSDDWLEDDAVEVMLVAQIENPGRFIIANFYRSDEGSSTRTLNNDESISSQIFGVEALVEGQALCKFKIYDYIPARFFSASLIREHNLFFKNDLRYGEDVLFSFMYLLITGGCFYVSKPLMTYFQRSDSVTNGRYSPRNTRSIIQARDEMIRLSPDSVKKFHLMSKKMSLIYALCRAYRDNADTDEIKFIREKVKEIPGDTAEKLTLINKIGRLARIYMPISLMKFIIRMGYAIRGR